MQTMTKPMMPNRKMREMPSKHSRIPHKLFQGEVKILTGGTVREPLFSGRTGEIPVPTVTVRMEETDCSEVYRCTPAAVQHQN